MAKIVSSLFSLLLITSRVAFSWEHNKVNITEISLCPDKGRDEIHLDLEIVQNSDGVRIFEGYITHIIPLDEQKLAQITIFDLNEKSSIPVYQSGLLPGCSTLEGIFRGSFEEFTITCVEGHCMNKPPNDPVCPIYSGIFKVNLPVSHVNEGFTESLGQYIYPGRFEAYFDTFDDHYNKVGCFMQKFECYDQAE